MPDLLLELFSEEIPARMQSSAAENLRKLVTDGLVEAGLVYEGAKAFRTPFVSGKDSLNNQFTTRDGRTIEIPPTLLITGVGMVPDLGRRVTSDAKGRGGAVVPEHPSKSRRVRLPIRGHLCRPCRSMAAHLAMADQQLFIRELKALAVYEWK